MSRVQAHGPRARQLVLSTLNEYRVSARGARIARRDNRGYWEYLREEQRGEAGCPARQAVLDQRGQATSPRNP